jgi:hypothetical protein
MIIKSYSLKNFIFWDVTRCGSGKKLTTATWHNIQEDGILYSHRRETLKSYFNLKISNVMMSQMTIKHIYLMLKE